MSEFFIACRRHFPIRCSGAVAKKASSMGTEPEVHLEPQLCFVSGEPVPDRQKPLIYLLINDDKS